MRNVPVTTTRMVNISHLASGRPGFSPLRKSHTHREALRAPGQRPCGQGAAQRSFITESRIPARRASQRAAGMARMRNASIGGHPRTFSRSREGTTTPSAGQSRARGASWDVGLPRGKFGPPPPFFLRRGGLNEVLCALRREVVLLLGSSLRSRHFSRSSLTPGGTWCSASSPREERGIKTTSKK